MARTWYLLNWNDGSYYNDERYTASGPGILAHLLAKCEQDYEEQFTSLLVSQLIWSERS
jgi:hypothetical protein